MIEGMSRRKALSLLGLGAALGFTLSAALMPSEAEAQEAATPPAAPAEATGTHGMNRRQSRRTGATKDATADMNDATRDERVRNPQQQLPPKGTARGTAPAPQ